MRLRGVALLLVLLAVFGVTVVTAQNIQVEWLRWDAIINVDSANDLLQVNETQEIEVTRGTLRQGTRFWVDDVDVDGVFIVTGSRPQALRENSSGDAGTYQVRTVNGEVTLTYYLPEPAERGDRFVVQINYTTPIENEGLFDMSVVPARRGFPVNSSTITINFPAGEAPDQTLVRFTAGSGSVTVEGDTVIIQSRGAIPADQNFAIQMPFGEGVGAAADSGSGSGSSGSGSSGSGGSSGGSTGIAPTGGTGGGGGIDPMFIMIGLVVVVLVLVAIGRGGSGRNLLSTLLGMFMGGAAGGRSSGGSSNPSGGIFGSGSSSTTRSTRSTDTQRDTQSRSSERGFRASRDQDRSVPQIKSDKDDDGGGASFG